MLELLRAGDAHPRRRDEDQHQRRNESVTSGRSRARRSSSTSIIRLREGTFLKETLGDFAGVLVSDFYAAYDSVTCHQQKCHLHLMRDINDDLLRHPFDEELKELARRYTLTLKPMVETIDKHGLKTKFLSKHKRDAEAFLDWIAKREVTSEVAQGYKSRIEKYGERLFTFLDYDGVPWNNNNAENALKLVASRRRLFGTSVSEAGLKDYLVFLSIYQTLRRKGISLLRFLLSGETGLGEVRGIVPEATMGHLALINARPQK